MPIDICGHRTWNDLGARWICRLDGFDCAGRPEPWGERCPGTRRTRTPCPDCPAPPGRTAVRLLRMDAPNLKGLFCPACGYAGTVRDCAMDLLERIRRRGDGERLNGSGDNPPQT